MSAEKAAKNTEDSKVIQFDANYRQGPANQEDTIDLLELGSELLARWWILLAAFVLGAVIMFVYTFAFVTPMYKSTSKIYVYSKSTSITSLTDLQIGTQLTSDFQIIAKTSEVVEEVIARNNLDMTYNQLLSRIAINNPDSSRILEIVITDSDPERAAAISNTLAEVLRTRIGEVTNTDEPSIVEKAVANYSKVSPSYSKNCLLGGLVLLIIAAAIIIVRHLLDDTIKTEEDIKKYLGLNTLAMIPVNRNEVQPVSQSSGSKHRHSKK